MTAAYVGIGSNLGDRLDNLSRALGLLARHEVNVRAVSSVYESEAAIVADQPDFLNLVTEVDCPASPRKLLEICLGVEQDMGRVRSTRYGPRVIDLDVLLYDRLEVREPDLTIPHPQICHRPFVLVPLLEVAPDCVMPGGQPVAHLLRPGMADAVKLFAPPLQPRGD